MIDKTGITSSLEPLLDAIHGRHEDVPSDFNGLLDIQIRELSDKIRASATTPMEIGRAYLQVVYPERSLLIKPHNGFVYHLPIITNPHALMLVNNGDGEKPKRLKEGNLPTVLTYHLDATGDTYVVDGSKVFMFLNAGEDEVMHLVLTTNQQPIRAPKDWTGMTTERMTGHHDFLEQDLVPGLRFS